MADDLESVDEKDTGSTLRKKYEAVLGEKQAMERELRSLKAQAILAGSGFTRVTVEDLADVSITDLESRAAELETQREQQEADILRRVLASKGLKDNELDTAVKELVGMSEQDRQIAALDRIRAVGRTGGTPPGQAEDPNLYGPSRIRAAYASS